MKTDTYRKTIRAHKVVKVYGTDKTLNKSGVPFHLFCLLLYFCSAMMLEKEGRKEMGRMHATDVPAAGRPHSKSVTSNWEVLIHGEAALVRA